MSNLRMSGSRSRVGYRKHGSVIIHQTAFREVSECRRCGKTLSTKPGRHFGRSTGLCKKCCAKLVITCPRCGKKGLINFMDGTNVKGHHLCYLDIPIREWREVVLAGEFIGDEKSHE